MKVTTVDTRHGSLNKPGFSNGNTLPYTGVPFGMNYFVLQNQMGSNWMFDPTYPLFQGIRLTHQPSPWMGDFSSFLMTPVTGMPTGTHVELNQSSYKIDRAFFQPHYFKADLLRYRLGVELAPTTYGAKLKLTNQSEKELGLLLHTNETIDYTVDRESNRLIGRLPQKVDSDKSLLYFYFVLDFGTAEEDKVSYLTFDEKEGWTKTLELEDTITSCLFISLGNHLEEAEISLGTSFISEQQALLNLERESLTESFEEIKEKAADEWEYYLSKIEVSDRDTQKVQDFNFYLYRMFLFPQTFYELDDENQPIHFDVYSNSIKKGKFFTNNGFWDTYKTVYPLYSLIIPEKYKEILEGIRHFYEESGHLPKWISPDERGLMPGTLVNAVIADAGVKGLLNEEEMRFLLDAMVKEATIPPTEEKFGRSGVQDTLAYGYVTNNKIESVNQTQDNAYSDFCIRQVAKILGEEEIAGQYEKAALNYHHLFDENSGFMRGKDAEGEYKESFVPEDWGYDYTEGSAWQNSLAVFHNFQDYIDVFGGKEAFLEHLVRLTNSDPTFEIGNYGMEIHEMSELATAEFGQIAISNQPSFHIPYLFAYIGKPAYTQLLVKQLCEHAFSTHFDGYPGDEDNGSMSGWVIFSMLGFYPVTPGVPQYVLGIPQFDKSVVHLPNGKTFTTVVPNQYPQNNFVQRTKLNSETMESLYLNHETILKGGKLEVKLGLLPSENDYLPHELPYSLKNEDS
ncbi:GH92 family glycosyl hydrolase [Desemzia sp. FAM 23991]|uniref:GH92 family glycosyl hydrolase n=1 Tax=unclassified Desemzia TaxID=2685243 RepID=UPI0038897250